MLDGRVKKEILLERQEELVESSRVKAAVVTLSGAKWLLVRDEVPEFLMRQAIDEGVASRQLHSSWNDWSGIGEVALAVPLEGDISNPRLYTFLPMGEGATAPFQGHLHGSFFPSSSRKALDAGVALNRILLKQAATLAATCVHWLAEEDAGSGHTVLNESERARATADLLVWSNPSSLIAAKTPAGSTRSGGLSRRGGGSSREARLRRRVSRSLRRYYRRPARIRMATSKEYPCVIQVSDVSAFETA